MAGMIQSLPLWRLSALAAANESLSRLGNRRDENVGENEAMYYNRYKKYGTWNQMKKKATL